MTSAVMRISECWVLGKLPTTSGSALESVAHIENMCMNKETRELKLYPGYIVTNDGRVFNSNGKYTEADLETFIG